MKPKFVILMLVAIVVAGSMVAISVEADNNPNSIEQEILNYRTWEMQLGGDTTRYKAIWKEKKLSEFKPFMDHRTEGVLVEIPQGSTGLHPVSAILVQYEKFKDHENLAVFNKTKNIALLAFDRWNTSCLSIGAPDADEIMQKHGFKCSSLDVARMLRLMGE